jgi:hypothetical protein
VVHATSGVYSVSTVITAEIADDAVTFAKMQNIATDRLIGRDTAATGDPEEIALNATLEWTGTGSIQRAALTGDVTAAAGSNSTTIANDVVTYAKIQNISATSRFLGRITAGAGDTEELTGTQATTLLDVFTSALKGLAPASGGGTTNFLRADGTWTAAGGFTAATQAEQEAASSTTVGTTPGTQQFHPSAAKAWVMFNSAGSVSASYNITSITDNAVGSWTVNIATDFSSAAYVASGMSGSAGNTPMTVQTTTTQAVGTFEVRIRNASSALADPTTPDAVYVTFFGDQ